MAGATRNIWKQRRSEIRAWLSAVGAIGSLLIAGLAVVLTVRDNGLKDLFTSQIARQASEIIRQNNDLDSLDRRAKVLDTRAQVLSDQLSAKGNDIAVANQKLQAVANRQFELQLAANSAQQKVTDAALALKSVQDTNTELTEGNSKIGAFLFKVLLRSYLREQHPTIADIATGPDSTYVFSPTDPLFRSVNGNEIPSYLFIEDDAARSGQDGVPIEELCRLDEHRVIVGMEFGTTAATTLKVTQLRASQSKLYRTVCTMVQTVFGVVSSEALRATNSNSVPATRRTYLWDILKGGAQFSPPLALLPGSFNGLSYEEFRSRGYWFRMVGDLYADTAAASLTANVADTLSAQLKAGASFSVDMARALDDTQQRGAADFKSRGLAPMKSQLKELDEAWLKTLGDTVWDVGFKQNAAMKDGKFSLVLDRFTSETFTADGLLQNRGRKRDFDYAVNCVAIRFAIDQRYVAEPALPEAPACVQHAKQSASFPGWSEQQFKELDKKRRN